MLHLVENLQFKADVKFVTKDSPCFFSLDYPPKDDFVMSINQNGDVISRYGHDTWDFSPFGLKQKLQFSNYDEVNKALFKRLMYYVIYSHLFPGRYNSIISWYQSYQNIFKKCSEEGVTATDINKFPRVIESIASDYSKNAPSGFSKSIFHYDAILKQEKEIGFKLLDKKSIAVFKQFDPDYEYGQTPYIPNRIWTKYILFLDSVLDDFKLYEDKLENLFHYLVETFNRNRKYKVKEPLISPFISGSYADRVSYNGTLEDYLNKNGLIELFEKYTERPEKHNHNLYQIDQFGSILNGIVTCCFLYVLYYSMMRKTEASSIKTDCFKVESDNQTGNLYLLVGETTKTVVDSDARWVVPKRVEKAINIAKKLVEWKMQHLQKPEETPYLFQNMNMWQTKRGDLKVKNIKSLDNIVSKTPYFYRLAEFNISLEDYNEAIALTPSLIKNEWFKVGGIWSFSFHQFRRTLAVHFALNKVSPSTTQYQMKHGTRMQQFHYQNNAGRLNLNKKAELEVLNEYYAEMGRNINSVVHGEFILPHKKAPVGRDVVCFVNDGDKKKLQKAQKNGAIGYRKNILGGCMKQGNCQYGGFDSISHCAGNEEKSMCSDLIIDGDMKNEFIADKDYYEAQMTNTPKGSPKYKFLRAEVRGYEKVIKIIVKKGDQ